MSNKTDKTELYKIAIVYKGNGGITKYKTAIYESHKQYKNNLTRKINWLKKCEPWFPFGLRAYKLMYIDNEFLWAITEEFGL